MDVFQFRQGRSESRSHVSHGLAILALVSVLLTLFIGFAGVVWSLAFLVVRWLLLRPQPELVTCDELGAACLQLPSGQQVRGQFDQAQRGFGYIRLRFRESAHEQASYVCIWFDSLSREEQSRLARISENIR
ncbi:MAG: hypothetical protein LAT77_00875 [Aliidiomarina sp.]|uniref:hypothetical protein n=1 Tax=Aliidiomarina sp. TaxID=1872439 RepID=UPI0025C38B73|nr:hypothetical protein [Aliidiomarina sp.]MCH8500445.1 hypothetical protein [Aliidiomarina sp.]